MIKDIPKIPEIIGYLLAFVFVVVATFELSYIFLANMPPIKVHLVP